jgi:hypothetical protein
MATKTAGSSNLTSAPGSSAPSCPDQFRVAALDEKGTVLAEIEE